MQPPHSHIVRAYHATTTDRVESILKDGLKEVSTKRSKSRWLGRGAYFFQESRELANKWAADLSAVRNKPPAVLEADVDLTNCMDLLDTEWHRLLRQSWERLRLERAANGEALPDQVGFAVENGEVKVRPFVFNKQEESADPRPGENQLDYEVIESTIEALKRTAGITIESVRAIFLEGGEIYPHSWIFDKAHIAIAVRPPFKRVSFLPGQFSS